jgi:hypothetical protein
MKETCKHCEGTGKLGFQRETCCFCGGKGYTGKDDKKVFLGGTCNESTWRDKLIPMLKIDYFNPVVDDWTEECYLEELRQREICDYCLYVITPLMTGVYSIAEVIDDSNKRPDKTLFCVLNKDYLPLNVETDNPITFNKGQMRSLERTGLMVQKNGGKYFKSLEEVAHYLNNDKESK